jgi:FkbM family methyltransferase
VRCGLAKGLRRKGGIEFTPRPLSLEERFLKKLDFAGQTIYDVGASEGVYSMFFSRAVGTKGKVISFEPHPRNCFKILENLRLNKMPNVKLCAIGLSREKGKAMLAFEDSDLARGTAVQEIGDKILDKKGSSTIEIEVDSLDNRVESLPRPDFIKIDVEGMELDVLCGMEHTIRKYKPRLLIEVHGTGKGKQSRIENAQRVMDFLIQRAYSIYHIEAESLITKPDLEVFRQVHLYCS